LFAQTNQQPQPVGLVAPPATATQGGPAPTPLVDAGSAQNMQDRKTAFLDAATDKRTVSPDRLEAKASPYIVQAGTGIPATLITGNRSDLPGQITAQVTEAVCDSPTGQYLLIPQGAKLVGQYDSSVAFGQSRMRSRDSFRATCRANGAGFQRGTQTRWQLFANDATGAPTLTDMGESVPIATGGVLTLCIAASPNGSSVWSRVVAEVSGAVFEQEITADSPAATQFLSPRPFPNTGATTAAVAYDYVKVYLQTEF